jgi:hypothetical protein
MVQLLNALQKTPPPVSRFLFLSGWIDG